MSLIIAHHHIRWVRTEFSNMNHELLIADAYETNPAQIAGSLYRAIKYLDCALEHVDDVQIALEDAVQSTRGDE